MILDMYDTDEMIKQLVALDIGRGSGVSADVLRRTLQALVSLAKSEQLLQMRLDVAASMGLSGPGLQ
jgi:hypothetical protein